ncbi:TonB family protein [Alkalimonas collagenimarina]|uniref:Protein TonB n=1 Tax=Alkalimonas collagenimarina TaxID=400390 RepID=A0ABT9GXD0_9GAMM|nr:TonB family protein [Alkalimonas collagenimarina]MDP4535717.1 TonB family protein [Alkalimonas collagenimarina]
MKWILPFCLLLAAHSSLAASWLDALDAYQRQDFATAKQGFVELIPLANETAAYNLGVMALHGQGQPVDEATALGYFFLAAELEHPGARSAIQQVSDALSAEQLSEAEQVYTALQQRIQLPKRRADAITQRTAGPEPVSRPAPQYPVDAARRGQFGYVMLRFLVDEEGKVQTIDTLDAFPQGVFERSATRAVRRWQYEATGEKHIVRVRMDFRLDADLNFQRVHALLHNDKLWDFANAGSPRHQEVLGTLFELVAMGSNISWQVRHELSEQDMAPDLSLFRDRSRLSASLDDFVGLAHIELGSGGRITQVDFLREGSNWDEEQLLAATINTAAAPGRYRILRSQNHRGRYQLHIQPIQELPANMTARYWWDMAARNGDRRAQQILAAFDLHWEQYLIAQQDPEVLAWSGTQRILNGETELGWAMLEQAIVQNNATAKALKKQLL